MTRCRRSACLGLAPLACAPSRLLPRELPLLRGSLIGGPVWFSLPGRGFPPRAPPRAISPTVRWVGWCGEVHIRDRLPRPAFPGIPLRSGVWDGSGIPGRHPVHAPPDPSPPLPPPRVVPRPGWHILVCFALPAAGRGGPWPWPLYRVRRAVTPHRVALWQCKIARRYRGRQDEEKGDPDPLEASRQKSAVPLRSLWIPSGENQNTGFLKYFSAPGLCRSSSLKKCSASPGSES